MIIDIAGTRYVKSIHELSNRFIKLNIIMKISDIKHPIIDPTDTILDINVIITNVIKADMADGIKIINNGPTPVATPLPPLNLWKIG